MKKVPCLMCLNIVDTIEDKAIATICKYCNTDENINNYLKNLNYKKIKNFLEDKAINNIKEIYKTGEDREILINKYGEVL